MKEAHVPIEQMEMFQDFVTIADWVWEQVERWRPLPRDTVGVQLVRSADSIGANLVEGDARYSSADAVRFFVIARASARETRYWLERAKTRRLLTPEDVDARLVSLNAAARQLNGIIRYRRAKGNPVHLREATAEYNVADADPLAVDLDLETD